MKNRVVWLIVLLLVLCISTDTVMAELIAYWPFEEGQGTTTADITGNGNDGTFNGDVQWDRARTDRLRNLCQERLRGGNPQVALPCGRRLGPERLW